MGYKVVILLMSILVVGLRTREVQANELADRKMLINSHAHHAHAHAQAGAHAQAKGRNTKNAAQAGVKSAPKGGRYSMKINNDIMSMKIVNDLCAATTYKDACTKSLSSLIATCGDSPHELFKSGLKLALDETTKASNLPKTLVPKAGANDMASSALETCTDSLGQAIDRLKLASDQLNAGDPSKALKDPQNIFNVRLELSDVNTFSTNCLDELTEAEAPELQKTMQDGVENAKELAVNMLDIISTYTF